ESATETLTLENTGDADLEFAFPGFAARARITELMRQGVDMKLRPSEASIELPKGVEPRAASRAESDMAQYRVAGPDAFGYVAIDSDEAGGPVYDFVDISGTGTLLTEADFDPEGCTFDPLDEGNALLNLPFTFSFYGEDYTTVKVNVNGHLN